MSRGYPKGGSAFAADDRKRGCQNDSTESVGFAATSANFYA
jgi:hypothetical protein